MKLALAKARNKEISTLTLKNTVTLPAFLEIGVILIGIKSLNAYLKEIHLGPLLLKSTGHLIPYYEKTKHPLDVHLHWNK